MVEKINRSKTYADKMRQEGKVTTFNKPKDIQVSIKMNESLEQFRREYQVKDRNSQMSASKVILTR
ncbi:MAG: hypothetical protein EZS26_002521 [Candidatus Ordinivivax streblomastigis]|jgi:hypothetical protein|uniref:Uncharacterized protein n=1 Tax=Candidatus Ordinivivax streblomastigis TaxID=2540710 RepID=A0A5M8NYU9_9BACT|nr:MAG: hypothetical protein EZS26_002521 [Candidatus Ordinivivax streblomastigis]